MELNHHIMKKVLFVVSMFWLAGVALAADSGWLTSLPDAQARAKMEKKVILLNFTGSDWCAACKVLEADALSKPEFADYARKKLVLVLVDFPLGLKQPEALQKANNRLQEKYKVEGYPTLILLNPDGDVVWTEHGYSGGGSKALIAELEKAQKK
jgi:protein disulfide-isomerase